MKVIVIPLDLWEKDRIEQAIKIRSEFSKHLYQPKISKKEFMQNNH